MTNQNTNRVVEKPAKAAVRKSLVTSCSVAELEAMQKTGTDDEVEGHGYVRVGRNLLVMADTRQ